MPEYWRDQRYLANAFGHFSIDILNSTVPLLLALFSASLGFSNATIGLIATLYTFGNSLTQPLFGWLADRYGSSLLGPGGLVWMAIFYSLAAISPGWVAVIFLILAGLGSAAYHPQGAARASHVHVGQVASATAVFFMFGQIGLGIGPAISGSLVQAWGQVSLLVLTSLSLVAALWLWRGGREVAPTATHDKVMVPDRASRYGWATMGLFAFLLFTRMSVQGTTNTFLPKYLQDMGWQVASYGLALSMLMIGSAIGNVIGGSLADRIGRRRVVAGSLFLAAPVIWIYLSLAGFAFFLAIFAIGFFTGAGFSVTVVMAQAMLPGRKALASGLVLGFIFASGAIGSAIAGAVGDVIGLATVLQGMAYVAVISGVSALLLPTTSQPAPHPAPQKP